MKALADFLFSLIALALLLPFCLFVAVLIFLFDLQSPLFIQNRLGQNKKSFKIIKFRSMRNNKVTLLGKIMRKTGIDEVPQLLNVLLGQMSLVGPRPLTAEDIERLKWDGDYYSVRWNLKPGIVGLAQLSPVCHKKMSWYLDRYYIRHQSFMLDAKILFSALLIPFIGKSRMKKLMHNR